MWMSHVIAIRAQCNKCYVKSLQRNSILALLVFILFLREIKDLIGLFFGLSEVTHDKCCNVRGFNKILT